MKKALLVIGISLLLGGCWETQNGEKIGSIVKIAKQGLICKTWEGQLIRGGMSGGTGSFGTQPFNFTVENEAVLAKVKAALESQKEVKIKYHKEAFTFCRSESYNDPSWNFFLDEIEEIK